MPPLVGEAQREAGSLLARLQGLRAAAALIARAAKDDARVMLHRLLTDLGRLAGLDAGALPAGAAALLAELRGEAAALRKRLGKPFAPEGQGPGRVGKEANHGTSRGRRPAPVLSGDEQPGREPRDRDPFPGPVPAVCGGVAGDEAGAGGPESVRRGAGEVFRAGAGKGRSRRGRPPRRFPHFRRRHPEAALWLTVGLIPKAALALTRAGFRALSDLRGATWETLCGIPGVGPGSVMVLEEVLGEPLPRKRARRKAPPAAAWPEHLWRKRGLPAGAAITFAQMSMTMERLQEMTREELLALQGVGPGTVKACELILGRANPSGRPARPSKGFWREQGIHPRAARALHDAGIHRIEDLGGLAREDLLALRGLGATNLKRLEALLGQELPSRNAVWRTHGLSEGAANALARAGIETLEQLGAFTREEFLSIPGLGYGALRRCERRLGRMLPYRRRGVLAGKP